jgi:glycosyltransferase involved in cell wall biosynthesis
MVEEFLESLLQFTLNRSHLRLNLPSVKFGTIVSECELEVPHPIGYSIAGRVRAGLRKITATIITFNEEARIGEAVASLSCCDEVIVVDSGSSDRTCAVASATGAHVISRSWEGYSKQKNFAAGKAANDWILSIDSDERVSIELATEIMAWKRSGETSTVAYSMPRRAFYLGKWIRHSGWYPDRKLRLYDRRHCRWEGDFVHEGVKVNGGSGQLNGDLLHFPYRDWADHETRIERYTALAAQAARSSGRRGNLVRLTLAPPLAFLKSYFLHAGFLDGWRGAAIAYMGARYVFKREFRILR